MAAVAAIRVDTGAPGAGFQARLLTLIFILAQIGFLVEHSSRGTNTMKGTGSILALSTVTHHGLQAALVLVHTLLPCHVHFISLVADASVATNKVFTGAVTANFWILSTFIDIVASVGEAGTMWTELTVLRRARQGTGRTGTTPTHQVGACLGVTAAGRLGNHGRSWVHTPAISVHCIAHSLDTVRAGFAIRSEGEAWYAAALVATGVVGALTPLTWVARALVHIFAGLSVGGELVAGLTHALEAAVHIHAPSVLTHTSLRAFIHVSTKAAVRGMFKAIFANANIGAWSVLASSF